MLSTVTREIDKIDKKVTYTIVILICALVTIVSPYENAGDHAMPSDDFSAHGYDVIGGSVNSGVGSRPFIDHPTCPRKPELASNRKCLKKCRSDLECRGRNRRCLCDDVCGKSCVKQTSRCESPKPLLNGRTEMTPYNTFGAKLHYTCDAGYVLVGVADRICQGDGFWSGERPTCQKSTDTPSDASYHIESKCGEPPVVEHATRDGPVGQKTYPLGTQLTYTCAPGYSLDGFFRAMCVGEGRWVGPRLTCSPRRCGHPGDTPNGLREGNVFVYPNRVRYTCVEGYELVGRPYRVCQADGQWSGALPMCRPVKCPKAHQPTNGYVQGTDYTYGAIVTFSCNRGFRLDGSSTRKCQQDGRWSGRDPSCLIVDCGKPGPFYNGYIDGQQTTFGSSVVFRCIGKSTFEGDFSTSTCQENGEWSHAVPKCWSKCEVPLVHNGTLEPGFSPGTFINHGNTLRFRCRDGFTNETSIPECRNGTWTSLPLCVPAPCKDRPPEVKYGIARFHTLQHGDRAKYKCNTGFELAGDTYLTCLYGNWSGVKPICEEKYCKYPGVIEHGQISLVGNVGKYEYRSYIRRVKHNEQIEYQCGKDFVRVGPAAATCVDGEWSPPNKPICEPKQHPRLLYIFRGRRDVAAAAVAAFNGQQ